MVPSVVFDTNVLISATLSTRGNPFRCISAAKEGVVTSITCVEILDEYEEKLRDKFGFEHDRALAAAQEIRGLSRVVTIPGMLKVIAEDHDDNMVIECAVIGEAEFIVSGDRHILGLKEHAGIRIVRVAEFIEIVARQH